MLGRPLHSYANPVRRLKAWSWLFTLMVQTGIFSVVELDAQWGGRGLFRGRIREILDEGTEPQIKKAQRDFPDSVWSVMAPQLSPEVRKILQQVLDHPLWKALESFSYAPAPSEQANHDRMMACAFRAAQVIPIAWDDAENAAAMELQWPKIFRKQPEPSDRYEPATRLLDLVPEGGFASLDGIYTLLIRLRENRNIGEWDLTSQLSEMLAKAVWQYGGSFFMPRWGEKRSCIRNHAEYGDTWEVVMKTCATHVTPFEVTEGLLKKASKQIADEFKHRDVRESVYGRKSVGPSECTRGRTGRRWGRIIYVRACCLALNRQNPVIGYVSDTSPVRWLVRERDRINAHIVRAMYLEYISAGTDPLICNEERSEALLNVLASSQSLRVPCDEDHRIGEPEDYKGLPRFGRSRKYMYLIPTPPEELDAIATMPPPLPTPEGRATTVNDAFEHFLPEEKGEDLSVPIYDPELRFDVK